MRSSDQRLFVLQVKFDLIRRQTRAASTARIYWSVHYKVRRISKSPGAPLIVPGEPGRSTSYSELGMLGPKDHAYWQLFHTTTCPLCRHQVGCLLASRLHARRRFSLLLITGQPR